MNKLTKSLLIAGLAISVCCATGFAEEKKKEDPKKPATTITANKDDIRDKLYQAALKARLNSHSPYSKFAVGAAVLSGGKIYGGTNVENASYGLTICAERCAIWKAVSEGERKFDAICVVADTAGPVSPFGGCRQVMSEFKIPRIILGNLKGDFKEFTLEGILPYQFEF